MAETYATHEQQERAEAEAPYLKVWGALLVLTVAEYLWARFLAGSTAALVGGLLAMAAVKAALVALYFMHVKFEGRWIYGLIAPVVFMAAVVVLGLVPDMVFPPREGESAEVAGAAAPVQTSVGDGATEAAP
jgi:cytochrome c oxidase subunit 4